MTGISNMKCEVVRTCSKLHIHYVQSINKEDQLPSGMLVYLNLQKSLVLSYQVCIFVKQVNQELVSVLRDR